MPKSMLLNNVSKFAYVARHFPSVVFQYQDAHGLEQASKLEAGEITKEEYDQWRYKYPEFDTTERWVKVPSQELSDILIKGLKDEELL